jgi:hypothetical protein
VEQLDALVLEGSRLDETIELGPAQGSLLLGG